MPGRSRQTTATTLPAPIGGLNDRDPVANMPQTDAVIMENWWPEPGRASVRKGYLAWAEGFPDRVWSVFEYLPPSGVPELFAASGGGIYDITSSGDVSNPVHDGHSNDRYQTVMSTTPGGNFLYAFNGENKPLLYDGTTWGEIDDNSTPISIDGVTATSLIDGAVFKNRLFLIEKNSLNLWYLPPNQVGGTVNSIDMGQIFQRGGYVVTAKTWTIDAGAGSDDHFVVISSNGEVAVFAGHDPSDATSWALVGVFYLGRPIGQRCAIKYGGDLLIICEDGVYPLGKGLLSSTVDRRVAITDKIQNGVVKAGRSLKALPGWELCLASDYSMVILNVPQSTGPAMQYAQNTITGSWAKFTGLDASTWCYSSLGLFFGSDKAVMQAWVGNSDNGGYITADCLQAFSHFGSMAQTKYFTMIRPYISANGDPSILFSLNGDYVPEKPSGNLPVNPPTGMVWGNMVWGNMVWGGGLEQVQSWLTTGKIAKAAGLRLYVQNNLASVEWAATDFLMTRGGLL